MSDPYALIECEVLMCGHPPTPPHSYSTLFFFLLVTLNAVGLFFRTGYGWGCLTILQLETLYFLWWPVMTAAGKEWNLSLVRIASLGSFSVADDLTTVSQCMEPIMRSSPKLWVRSDSSSSTASTFLYASLLCVYETIRGANKNSKVLLRETVPDPLWLTLLYCFYVGEPIKRVH